MKENEPYSISKEKLSELKMQLHRIPQMHSTERSIAYNPGNKPVVLRGVITVLSVAASIMIAVILWPSEPMESEVPAVSLLDDLYELGYLEMRNYYSYIEPDSLGFSNIKSDSTILSNYNEYLNNYFNEI